MRITVRCTVSIMCGIAVIAGGPAVAGSANAAAAPIDVMAIIPLSGPSDVFPQVQAANEVAFKYINAHGGIGGHQVKLTICDDQNNPNQAAACATQAVSEHDVAVTGSFSFYGANVMNVLTPHGIVYMPVLPASSQELSAPDSYSFSMGLLENIEEGNAAGSAAKKGTSIAEVESPGPETTLENDLFEAGLKSAGYTRSVKIVPVQAQATDYAPAVAQAMQGTSVISLQLTQQQADVMLPALQQAGATQKLVGLAGNSLAAQVIKANSAITNGAVMTDFYAPIASPKWAPFRTAFAKYATSSQKGDDLSDLGARGAWIDAQVLDQVVSKINGSITVTSVATAFKHATSVSTGGVTPPIDLSKPFPEASLHAVYNTWGTTESVANGKIVWNSKFFDIAPAYNKYIAKTK
jgi:ABC-type branched-subunit amino acid transport system substrate-binding protein